MNEPTTGVNTLNPNEAETIANYLEGSATEAEKRKRETEAMLWNAKRVLDAVKAILDRRTRRPKGKALSQEESDLKKFDEISGLMRREWK